MVETNDTVTILARGIPRDLVDVIGICAIGIPQASLVFGPAFYLGYWVQGNIHDSLLFDLGASILFLAVYFPFLVRGVQIGPNGLHFRRVWGWPRFVPWERIAEISKVSRWEMVVNQSLSPWRCTGSTSHNVFRIQWDGRRFYFPPHDVEQFCQAVHGWRPDLMPLYGPEPPDAAQRLPKGHETGNPYQSPLSDLARPPDDEVSDR